MYVVRTFMLKLYTVYVEIFMGTIFRGLASKTGKEIFAGF